MIYFDMCATSEFEYSMDERLGDYFHLLQTYKEKQYRIYSLTSMISH